MSHFVVTAIVPKHIVDEAEVEGDEFPITGFIEILMAPYCEHLEIPHVNVMGKRDLSRMRKWYKEKEGLVNPSLAELAKKDWHGTEQWVVGDTLAYRSTYNPKSKWDWYVIGGRWDGAMRGLEELEDADHGFHFDQKFRTIGRNMCPVSELIEREYLPFAVLTPDGKWHERAKMLWFAIEKDPKEGDAWKDEVLAILRKYEDYVAVSLDCHI